MQLLNKKRISFFLILALSISGLGIFYFSQADRNTMNSKENLPKKVTFMRKGEIWVKDFSTNQEYRISESSPVSQPTFSPKGTYVTYHSLVHAGGGRPSGALYLSSAVPDENFKEELIGNEVGLTNIVSYITWSDDEQLVGFLSFAEDGTVKIYDTQTKKEMLHKNIAEENPQLRIDEGLNIQLECERFSSKENEKEFCQKFEDALRNKIQITDKRYREAHYKQSHFAKPEYRLTTSRKLNNELVALEFYTGTPQNPESNWEIGGGIFVPGYDEGVTSTYTLLINEITGTVVIEVPQAIETDFVY